MKLTTFLLLLLLIYVVLVSGMNDEKNEDDEWNEDDNFVVVEKHEKVESYAERAAIFRRENVKETVGKETAVERTTKKASSIVQTIKGSTYEYFSGKTAQEKAAREHVREIKRNDLNSRERSEKWKNLFFCN